MPVIQKYYTHHIVSITLFNSFDPIGGIIVGLSVNLLVYKSSKMKIILITAKQTLNFIPIHTSQEFMTEIFAAD
jgi:hypothetical protein